MLGVMAMRVIEGWTGEMTVRRRDYQYMQWIELLWGIVKGSECGRVCSVDQVAGLWESGEAVSRLGSSCTVADEVDSPARIDSRAVSKNQD